MTIKAVSALAARAFAGLRETRVSMVLPVGGRHARRSK
jgi:hypothetical protein